MYDVDAITEEPLLLEPLRASVYSGAAPAYLRSLKIKITARCNLKCVMCRYGRGWAPPELDGERWLGVLDEAAALGCKKVHFSGGEVLVRRDFETLLERSAALGMKVTFTSNLTLLDKQRAKRVLAHKISSISTSLDGASRKVHEAVRGIPGSFARTLRALAFIRHYAANGRPRVRVNFVMMRENFRDYPELVRLAHEHGAVDVVPMPVDSKRRELRLSKRLIREYNTAIAPRVREARALAGMPLSDGYIYPFGATSAEIDDSSAGAYARSYYRDAQCFAPFLHAFIAWDGNVYLCCMTNGRIESLGNVARDSLHGVFTGWRFQAVRTAMLRERLPACHACDMYLAENAQLSAHIDPQKVVERLACAPPVRRLPLIA